MEIRIENSISALEIEKLKKVLDNFFKLDFSITVEGSYTYFRDV